MRPKNRNSGTSANLSATVSSWAAALGIDPKTLATRLRAAGHSIVQGKRWSARDVFVAWVGDAEKARARESNARAESLEIKSDLLRRDVIRRLEVAEYIRRTFAPVRERSLEMPGIMAPLCNPTDPPHARAHLVEWVDGFLRHCRECSPPESAE